MQSTLKIHIKKTNKQNKLRIILCLLGSNSSSTTFSLSTDHHDSWRLGHRHLLPENPFSPNTKNQNKASKTRFSKAHTRTHLIACMQVSFWLQLLVFQDSEHRFLYKLSLDYNQSHDRRPKSLFRFPDNPPQNPHLSWHIHLRLSLLRYGSLILEAVLAVMDGSSSWHEPIYHWPPEKDQGILSPNKTWNTGSILQWHFQRRESAGHMAAADLKVNYPLCLYCLKWPQIPQTKMEFILENHVCERQIKMEPISTCIDSRFY